MAVLHLSGTQTIRDMYDINRSVNENFVTTDVVIISSGLIQLNLRIAKITGKMVSSSKGTLVRSIDRQLHAFFLFSEMPECLS